jgi:hypothetical protein
VIASQVPLPQEMKQPPILIPMALTRVSGFGVRTARNEECRAELKVTW